MVRSASLGTLLAVAVALAACTAGATAGDPAATAGGSATVTRESTTSPQPTASPSAPALVADGTAAQNLPLFTEVVASVWSSPDRASGRAYVDALVAAGFDKQAMQVTADTSTVGNPAESIQFSVLWQDDCLVGQVGPATGEPYTVVVPELAEGSCLVGATRPIDW